MAPVPKPVQTDDIISLKDIKDLSRSTEALSKFKDEAYRQSVLSKLSAAAGIYGGTSAQTAEIVDAMLRTVFGQLKSGKIVVNDNVPSDAMPEFMRQVMFYAYKATESNPTERAKFLERLRTLPHEPGLDNKFVPLFEVNCELTALGAIVDFSNLPQKKRADGAASIVGMQKALGSGSFLYGTDMNKLLDACQLLLKSPNASDRSGAAIILGGIDYNIASAHRDQALAMLRTAYDKESDIHVKEDLKRVLNSPEFSSKGVAVVDLNNFNDLASALRWSAGVLLTEEGSDLLPVYLQPGQGINPSPTSAPAFSFTRMGYYATALAQYASTHVLGTTPDQNLLVPDPNGTITGPDGRRLRASTQGEYITYLLSAINSAIGGRWDDAATSQKVNATINRLASTLDTEFIQLLPPSNVTYARGRYDATFAPTTREIYIFNQTGQQSPGRPTIDVYEQTKNTFEGEYTNDDDQKFKAMLMETGMEKLGNIPGITLMTPAEKQAMGQYFAGTYDASQGMYTGGRWDNYFYSMSLDQISKVFIDVNGDGTVNYADVTAALAVLANGDFQAFYAALNHTTSISENPLAANFAGTFKLVIEQFQSTPLYFLGVGVYNPEFPAQQVETRTQMKAVGKKNYENYVTGKSKGAVPSTGPNVVISFDNSTIEAGIFHTTQEKTTITLNPQDLTPIKVTEKSEKKGVGVGQTALYGNIAFNSDFIKRGLVDSGLPGDPATLQWAINQFTDLRFGLIFGGTSNAGDIFQGIDTYNWGIDLGHQNPVGPAPFYPLGWFFKHRSQGPLKYNEYGLKFGGTAGIPGAVWTADIGVRDVSGQPAKPLVQAVLDLGGMWNAALARATGGMTLGFRGQINMAPDFNRPLFKQAYEASVRIDANLLPWRSLGWDVPGGLGLGVELTNAGVFNDLPGVSRPLDRFVFLPIGRINIGIPVGKITF